MLPHHEIVARLVVSAVLGALVGLERERLEWVAGLRTHMLVCLGATLIMIVSAYGFDDALHQEHVVLDPSRVAAQVVSGIGFLGAGTILFLRQRVIRGLTTAASLWAVAGVGLAVGGGLYLAATTTTVLVLIILAIVKPLEVRLFRRNRAKRITIEIDTGAAQLSQIERELAAIDNKVTRIVITRDAARDNVDLIEVELRRPLLPAASESLLTALHAIRGVRRVAFSLDPNVH